MNVDMAMPMDGLMTAANNFEASPSANVVPDIDLAIDENFTWEMIGLGLEEPLPTQEAIDDLYGGKRVCTSKANISTEPTSISKRYTLRVQ